MASARETAMQALAAALEVTGATVWRSTDLTRDIPDAGMITVTEGGAYAPEMVLSPLSYLHEMPALVEVSIVGADEPTRDAALDALLQSISAALLADRTLGGAVETLLIDPPDFQAFEDNGAAKAAQFTVTLSFTTVGSPLA